MCALYACSNIKGYQGSKKRLQQHLPPKLPCNIGLFSGTQTIISNQLTIAHKVLADGRQASRRPAKVTPRDPSIPRAMPCQPQCTTGTNDYGTMSMGTMVSLSARDMLSSSKIEEDAASSVAMRGQHIELDAEMMPELTATQQPCILGRGRMGSGI